MAESSVITSYDILIFFPFWFFIYWEAREIHISELEVTELVEDVIVHWQEV